MKLFTIVLMLLVFGAIYFVMDYYKVMEHEAVHEQIAIYHGCTDPEIYYSFFGRSVFRCHDYADRKPEQRDEEYMLHSINEIITYNVVLTNIVIVLCSLAICFFHYKTNMGARKMDEEFWEKYQSYMDQIGQEVIEDDK